MMFHADGVQAYVSTPCSAPQWQAWNIASHYHTGPIWEGQGAPVATGEVSAFGLSILNRELLLWHPQHPVFSSVVLED